MHNRSCSPQAFHDPQFGLVIPTNTSPLLSYCHGDTFKLLSCEEEGVMFLLHASTSLSLFLILIHFFSFLLVKLFTSRLHRAISNSKGLTRRDDHEETIIDECHFENEDHFVPDVFGKEEGLFFFYSENAVKDTLLIMEGRDSNYEQQDLFEAETNSCASEYRSPEEYIAEEEELNVSLTSAETPSPSLSPLVFVPETLAFEDLSTYTKDFDDHDEEKGFAEKGKIFAIKHSYTDSKRIGLEDVHEDKESTLGGSLTCESTSKSSMEWKSSTIFQDSETEYPFSSSSRRSSSHWETFALFKKYDEEMMFFDRIIAQKLTEAESFRLINVQPRSVSKRIVHKLMTKHKNASRDPHRELESAYVSQVCLAWEALNWNYNNFWRKIADRDREASSCPARIAQRFQQFQVLLQRFIENEPYEHGRRPEVFARIRKTSPKLLQVPEYQDSDDDESKEDMISSLEFLMILEDAIRTFMNFIKADKENPCQMIKAFVKRRSSTIDPHHLHLLRKANKKKKMRLKDIVRSCRCPRKRKLKGEQEMEITMSLIDMKVVSRVLRMPEISPEQLHWCEEKMSKVRVSDRRLYRDPSPLFFPVHVGLV